MWFHKECILSHFGSVHFKLLPPWGGGFAFSEYGKRHNKVQALFRWWGLLQRAQLGLQVRQKARLNRFNYLYRPLKITIYTPFYFRSYACFQYFCYDWTAKAVEASEAAQSPGLKSCKSHKDCPEGNECFRHHSRRKVRPTI